MCLDAGGRRSLQTDTTGNTVTSVNSDNAADLLDPHNDDEFEDSPMEPNINGQLEKLLKIAKRHKAAPVLFKLHTLKQYLVLLERFHRNPKIKNPATRASLAVACSIGRGPYFARQL